MKVPDRRRAPRKRSEAVLELFGDDGQLIIGVGRLIDLSTVGARFETRKALQEGQNLRARFKLPKGPKVEMGARVVWRRKKRDGSVYAVEFLSARKR
jgi:hypothetical protein